MAINGDYGIIGINVFGMIQGIMTIGKINKKLSTFFFFLLISDHKLALPQNFLSTFRAWCRRHIPSCITICQCILKIKHFSPKNSKWQDAQNCRLGKIGYHFTQHAAMNVKRPVLWFFWAKILRFPQTTHNLLCTMTQRRPPWLNQVSTKLVFCNANRQVITRKLEK